MDENFSVVKGIVLRHWSGRHDDVIFTCLSVCHRASRVGRLRRHSESVVDFRIRSTVEATEIAVEQPIILKKCVHLFQPDIPANLLLPSPSQTLY